MYRQPDKQKSRVTHTSAEIAALDSGGGFSICCFPQPVVIQTTTDKSHFWPEAKEGKTERMGTDNMESPPASATKEASSMVFAGDYLNKLTGEKIERECRIRLEDGCRELVVNFSNTEIVNSIGVSILLGIIDSAANFGADVVFAGMNDNTAELFEMLGVTRHVAVR
ncbi:MAG TPA: hypothetical protein DEA22_00580 [Blastocatellia bacterium]|nr:hypothetical protein [Blastocatellia bacterium]